MSGHEAMEHAHTRRVTFLPPPPLPSLPTSFATSAAVQHIVNNSRTFSPLLPSRANETRGKTRGTAALRVT